MANTKHKEILTSPSAAYGVTILRNLGLGEEAIAGVLGSLMQESLLDPTAYNDKDPNGGSFGIAQWNGSRLRDLHEFADKTQQEATSFETQWQFIAQELKTSEKGAFDRVLAASTRGEAADLWTRHFERPSKAGLMLETRRRYADDAGATLGVGGKPRAPLGEDSRLAAERAAQAVNGKDASGPSVDGANSTSGGASGIGDFAGAIGVGPNKDGSAGRGFSMAGGLIGGLVGGPPGAMLGGVLGAIADRALSDDASESFESIGNVLDGLFGSVAGGKAAGGSSGKGSGGIGTIGGNVGESSFGGGSMAGASNNGAGTGTGAFGGGQGIGASYGGSGDKGFGAGSFGGDLGFEGGFGF